ncbi:hypothetical protein HPB51_022668 [Rhipicephalus microplus]|uniref:Uncharacterized protein n=1 Tax=Rhipicephalus microplus TaxID=6941 RepID=A0A9J6D796_RHIMP|nr:hypothetical protein HPB51_022668 [Rhipicephalus microplus]
MLSMLYRRRDYRCDILVIQNRHIVFVGTLGLVTAAVWIGVPVAVCNFMVRCEGIKCLSLEVDLRRTMDLAARPCHDFYQHVCGRWTQFERFYEGPLYAYLFVIKSSPHA